MKNPQEVDLEDMKLTLRVLKYKNLLPQDPKHVEMEYKFHRTAAYALIKSCVCCGFPFLIREFHSLSKWKKIPILGGIIIITYWFQIMENYNELNAYNRMVA